jgi:hypothetical protein
MAMLPYERLGENIHEHIYCAKGEKVLQRRPFRWKLNGQVVCNAYESFSMESVCDDNGFEIVERYADDLAIVKPKQEGTK